MMKVKKTLAICFVSFCMIAPAVPVYAGNGNTTVYVTDKGDCYHKSNCSTIKNSKTKTAVTLQEAVEDWGRRPCKKCKPAKYTN